jgi:hypothetical protein
MTFVIKVYATPKEFNMFGRHERTKPETKRRYRHVYKGWYTTKRGNIYQIDVKDYKKWAKY